MVAEPARRLKYNRGVDLDSYALPVYAALPERTPAPGVIVVPTWWGLNGFFRDLCDRLAREGYTAFGLDYYGGRTAATVEGARELRKSIDRKTLNPAMKATVRALASHAHVADEPFRIAGFSLGGFFALWLIDNLPRDFSAAAIFYAVSGGRFRRARAAVQGHFVVDDAFGDTPESAETMREYMAASGMETEFHSYPGVAHWFFEADRPEYDPDAARLAWERMLRFFRPAGA